MGTQHLEAARQYHPVDFIAPNSVSIVLVHDSGFTDTTAAGEIFQSWNKHDNRGLLRAPYSAPVPPLNTLATGVLVEQYARHNHHPYLIVVASTAPYGVIPETGDQRKVIPLKGSKEQPFALARLKNGVPVFFVNTGFTASGIKDHAEGGIWEIDVDPTGTSGFRMRDDFARAVTDFIYNDGPVIDEQIDPDTIPAYPDQRLALIDGQGNLQATTRISQWPEVLYDQEFISVTVDDQVMIAKNRITREGYSGAGDVVAQIGSLGGRKDPFIEVALVGHQPENARDIFNIEQLYRENVVFRFDPPDVAQQYLRDHGRSAPLVFPASPIKIHGNGDTVVGIEGADYEDRHP